MNTGSYVTTNRKQSSFEGLFERKHAIKIKNCNLETLLNVRTHYSIISRTILFSTPENSMTQFHQLWEFWKYIIYFLWRRFLRFSYQYTSHCSLPLEWLHVTIVHIIWILLLSVLKAHTRSKDINVNLNVHTYTRAQKRKIAIYRG